MKLSQAIPITFSLIASFVLAGCGIGKIASPTSDVPGSYAPGNIQGIVHGGMQPVKGAIVKMYATQSITAPTSSNNYGYGQPGLFLAEANSQDGSFGDGYDTDANGAFQFAAGHYVAGCPAGQYAYITISGGNSGAASNNPNLLLMSVLGPCSSLYAGDGETYTGPTPVFVDEVTTVAAAYTLGNFMTVSGTASPFTVNISAPANNNFSDGTVAWNATSSAYESCTGTACNGSATFNSTTGVESIVANGLYHAVLNFENLVSTTTGQANASVTTGVTGATGIIPVAEINSIANALQLCVNSIGVSSTGTTNCGQLFSYTPSIASVTPTNTLQAVLNLAKNPYSSASNVSNLLNFQTAQSQAYGPALSQAPPDWTLTIVYGGGGISTPYYLTLDANDEVYTSNQGTNTIAALTSNGSFKSGVGGFPFSIDGGTTLLANPQGIVADALGNIFVTNQTASASAGTFEFSNTGTYEATLGHTTQISYPYYLAVDRRNNVWVSYATNGVGNLDWLQYGGTVGSYTPASLTGNKNTYSNGGFTQVSASTGANNLGVILDSDQNVWIAVQGNTTNPGTAVGILTNAYAATPATVPAYDNSTLAGTAPYNHPKLLPAISPNCNTNPYTTAFDSGKVAYVSTIGATAPGICKITLGYTSSVATSDTVSTPIINVGAGLPEGIAMDGNNVLWIPEYNANTATHANYGLAAYNTVTSTLVSEPTNGFTSCFVTGSTCAAGSTSSAVNTGLSISNPRQAAIDSTGSIWLTESAGNTLTQTLGTAAPTWPLLAAGRFGVIPY
ncbi:MAG TPA: hypothetical protein VGB94_02825 [Acidobacteriaceae bacterium]